MAKKRSRRGGGAAPQHCRKALSSCMKGGGRSKAKAGTCMRKFNACRR